MPTKIVDFSAVSKIIRDEPFHLHFWESTPREVLAYLKDPRRFLSKMGLDLPKDCRIETVIENHDFLSARTGGLASSDGPIIICGTGGGNVAKTYYRVSLYAHSEAEVGKFRKKLLHGVNEPERVQKKAGRTK